MRHSLVFGIASLALTVGAQVNAQDHFRRTPATYNESFRSLSERDLYRLNDVRRDRVNANQFADRDDETYHQVQRASCRNARAFGYGEVVPPRDRPLSSYRPIISDPYRDVRRYSGYRPQPQHRVAYQPTPVVPNRFYTGRNMYGQPSVFTNDQPVRNFFRSLIP